MVKSFSCFKLFAFSKALLNSKKNRPITIKKIVVTSIEEMNVVNEVINENPDNPCIGMLLIKYNAEISRKRILVTPINTNNFPAFFKLLITVVE